MTLKTSGMLYKSMAEVAIKKRVPESMSTIDTPGHPWLASNMKAAPCVSARKGMNRHQTSSKVFFSKPWGREEHQVFWPEDNTCTCVQYKYMVCVRTMTTWQVKLLYCTVYAKLLKYLNKVTTSQEIGWNCVAKRPMNMLAMNITSDSWLATHTMIKRVTISHAERKITSWKMTANTGWDKSILS